MKEDESGEQTPSAAESVAGGVALLTGFGLAGLLLALGVSWWWMGFVLLGGLVPLARGLARWYTEDDRGARADGPTDAEQDALEELRTRYARGELTDAEFERQVERLLETETPADAREYARRDAERESATE